MSTLRANNIGNVAGTASTDVLNVINGSAKAWVNFNGTGTVAIRQGYNVSSITDNGVGDYTVNLTNALPDANYAVSCMVRNGNTNGNRGAAGGQLEAGATPSASAFRMWTAYGSITTSNGAKDDCDYVLVAVFR